MAEPQPPDVVEGAQGDIEEEVQPKAKSAEDRKAAAALAKLDAAPKDDEAKDVDQKAVHEAMNRLAGGPAVKKAEVKEVRKVKVEASDVALLVDQLDVSKTKATELLKANEGDAVKAMRAFIAVDF